MKPQEIKDRLQPWKDQIKEAEKEFERRLQSLKNEILLSVKDKKVNLLTGTFEGESGVIYGIHFDYDYNLFYKVRFPSIEGYWAKDEFQFIE